jgi:glycosyltransferase involved in cell wall biosynthesis
MITVIIPAHDEGTVIKRTLNAILSSAEPQELDIVVVCNGCTDETATVARSFGLPVRVIETPIANKASALNLGDQAARGFPRIYMDADVVLTTDAIRELADSLKGDTIVAVAPTGRYDMSGCSRLVRAFFEVRSYLPSAREGIGGSGVYALSEKGRSRFKYFPSVTADDGYVRLQFRPHERRTLPCVYSTVFAPRTIKSLLAQKTRSHYGSYELQRLFPDLWRSRGENNYKSLIRLFSRPQLWLSLSVYSFVTGIARRQAWKRLRTRQVCWDRDNSSRSVA